jgi:integrase
MVMLLPLPWVNIMRKAVRIQAEKFNLDPPLSMLRYEKEEDDEDNARTRILSIDEETALRNVLSDSKRNAEIWNLLVTVAIETGARVGEIVQFEPSQLNDSLTVLHILKEQTKANKERYVPLSTKAQSMRPVNTS